MGGNISIAYRMSGFGLFSFVCTKCLAPEIQSLGARGQEHPNRGSAHGPFLGGEGLPRRAQWVWSALLARLAVCLGQQLLWGPLGHGSLCSWLEFLSLKNSHLPWERLSTLLQALGPESRKGVLGQLNCPAPLTAVKTIDSSQSEGCYGSRIAAGRQDVQWQFTRPRLVGYS